MNGFKLLAIRPLPGCDKKYLKNLKEGMLYKFYQDYKFYVKDDLEKDIELTQINFDLFKNKSISKIDPPKNEVDLYSQDDLKINISAVVGKNGSGKSTLFDLFFLANYIIAIHGEILLPNLFSIARRKKQISELEKNIDKSEEELNKESEYKNLSDQEKTIKDLVDKFKIEIYYQIRENIYCIYIDQGLITQNLLRGNLEEKRNYVLKYVLQEKKFEFEDFFYSIAINYSFYSMNSEFMGGWIESLFHKNDGYQTPIVINPYRDSGNIDISKEIYLSKQRLISNILKPKIEGQSDPRILTDDQRVGYLIFSIDKDKTQYAYKRWKNGEEIKLPFEQISFGVEYDFAIEKLSPITKKDFIELLVKSFLGQEFDLVSMTEVKFYDEIEKYIIKKLIQIALTYRKYKDYFLEEDRPISIPKRGDTRSDYITIPKLSFYKTSEFISLLIADDSHITFKLKQAINYLKVNPFKSYEKKTIDLSYAKVEGYKIPVMELSEIVGQHAENQRKIIYYIPPSLFSVEIEFLPLKEESSNKLSVSYYSMLSSGEQQLIQSVQSILYHINNLESVFEDQSNSDEDKKEYHRVNIILDEIELYFHPDFQRKFIKHLIDSLKVIGTQRIKDFNILFATHSPFILSDIPSQNVLRLENGKPSKIEQNGTFGANVHDLLHDDFFLNMGFMGEFAKNKINEVITFINNKKRLDQLNKNLIPDSEEEYTEIEDKKSEKAKKINKRIEGYKNESEELSNIEFEQFKEGFYSIIKLIGEPALKGKIREMFFNAFPEIEQEELYEIELSLLKKKYKKK